MKSLQALLIMLGLTGFCAVSAAQGSAPESLKLDIEAQPMSDALNEFARQSGLQVVIDWEESTGVRAPRVAGTFAVEDALNRLLENSGLEFEFINARTVAVREKGARQAAQELTIAQGMQLAQAESGSMPLVGGASPPGTGTGEESQNATSDSSATNLTPLKKEEEQDPERAGIPEILVTGSAIRTLNMDIRRTRDDIQPYVIFDRELIERSGAIDLDDFFKKTLTMSTGAQFASQGANPDGNRSTVDLRGLGVDETLILIDGRRIAGVNVEGRAGQPDINGIPLAAIERIEVLPTTASGIYGGGATGGVINIVMRRDYTGLEAKLTYGDVFEGSAMNRRVDLSAGWDAEEGKTHVLVTGSYADSDPLLTNERDLIQRGRRHILANNPDFFYSGFYLPLGATTNIRSNTRVNGQRQNLALKDGTSLDSPITFVPIAYQGAMSDGGAAFVMNAGEYNLDLADTAQNDRGGRKALINHPTIASLMITARREFTPRVQAFVEVNVGDTQGRFANSQTSTLGIIIPSSAPNNPFQQDIQVAAPTIGVDTEIVSDSEAQRVVSGLIIRLPREWKAEMDVAWSRSRFGYSVPNDLTPEAVEAIGNGSLDVLRDLNSFPEVFPTISSPRLALSAADATLRNAAVRFAGPLPWSAPGGKPVVSLLAEHREEAFDEAIQTVLETQSLIPDREQTVDSTYLETRIPLISDLNQLRGVQRFELQIAARMDLYKVRSSTANVDLANPVPIVQVTKRDSSIDPTIGLQYQPFEDLMLRASYGTGYLPPSVSQLVSDVPATYPLGAFGLTDPLRGNEPLDSVTLVQGGSPDLRPERSESQSVGLVFSPGIVPGLRLSADWNRIKKRDNITVLNPFSQEGVNDLLTAAPDRFTRGSPSDGFSVGPITAIDASSINLAQLNVTTLDLALDYAFGWNQLGFFDLSAGATRLISLETQVTPASPVVENAGVLLLTTQTAGGVRWRANSSIRWSRGNWRMGLRSRFFDSYFLNTNHLVNANQGSATVSGQIYHDLFGSYRIDSLTWLSDMEVQFDVNNVFNKRPPVDVASGLAPYYSSLGDPRMASYYISVRKHFGGN